MSTFGDSLSNNILAECEYARDEGKTLQDVLRALTEVLQYIIRYWL